MPIQLYYRQGWKNHDFFAKIENIDLIDTIDSINNHELISDAFIGNKNFSI